jgi:hypothetical protein
VRAHARAQREHHSRCCGATISSIKKTVITGTSVAPVSGGAHDVDADRSEPHGVDEHRYRTCPAVRASISNDGLVILDVRGGLVLASNEVGARIWQLIDQRYTRGEIARRLVDDYGVGRERALVDVAAFVDALVGRGLVVEEPSW